MRCYHIVLILPKDRGSLWIGLLRHLKRMLLLKLTNHLHILKLQVRPFKNVGTFTINLANNLFLFTKLFDSKDLLLRHYIYRFAYGLIE